jgi:hypothetical protein
MRNRPFELPDQESFLEESPDLIIPDDQDDENLLIASVMPRVVKITDLQENQIEIAEDYQKIKDLNLKLFIKRHGEGLDIWSGEKLRCKK